MNDGGSVDGEADPQSEGEVTLNSSNPSDAPKVDPKLLSHPFDRRVIIEAMRSMMDYLEAPVFKKNTVKMIGCPKSRSEEDIWVGVSSHQVPTRRPLRGLTKTGSLLRQPFLVLAYVLNCSNRQERPERRLRGYRLQSQWR